MKRIKQVTQVLLVVIFLTSCRTSINKKSTLTNSEENIYEDIKRMEIKFSCEEEDISEYLEDGWIIVEEDSQEKICTWKSVPASKDCDMEKDKGCKITKPDRIGEVKTYLLEK